MAGRRSTERRNGLGPILVTAVAAVAWSTSCTRSGETLAASPCAQAVASAADAIDLDDQKERLDLALLQCRSVADLSNEINRHPGLLGHSVASYVESRCGRIDDEAILAGPVCSTSVTTVTVTVADPPTGPVFVGDTLDGRPIEIRPGPDTLFVGDIPQVVQQTVDIAAESGCPGILQQRDRWFALIDDPAIGDEASVYTQHAENVAEYLGCQLAPPGAPVPDPAATTG